MGLLPAWLWWAWSNRGQVGPYERNRWRERLALNQYPVSAQNGLLLHAASIGEAVAAIGLLRALREIEPELPLLVTCTSFSGAQRLRRDLGAGVQQAFLPFDTPGAMTRLLDQVRPRAIVLMETELWPNLLAAARERAIPVILANARLSARSARGYALLSSLSRPMLSGLTQVQAQTRPIARRFMTLGVSADRLVITGNIKYDLDVPPAARNRAAEWRQHLGDRLVVVAASTHPREDEVLLEAWHQVLERHPRALLVLVPRHPQRFDHVSRLISQKGFPLLRHSLREAPWGTGAWSPVWLADTLGEMLTWMALADITFVGGSLVPHGGHSPIEAMVFGRPIVSGRHVRNFADAYRALNRTGGVAWVEDCDPVAVANALDNLLGNSIERARVGDGGRRVFEAGTGAAKQSARMISDLLCQSAGTVQ